MENNYNKFVDLKVAKQLMDAGWDMYTCTQYDEQGNILALNSSECDNVIYRPTLEQANNFIREKYNWVIQLFQISNMPGWTFSAYKMEDNKRPDESLVYTMPIIPNADYEMIYNWGLMHALNRI